MLIESHVGRPRDGLYEPILADSEREAVADLLQFLENASWLPTEFFHQAHPL
jgi:vacuolar protein 8